MSITLYITMSMIKYNNKHNNNILIPYDNQVFKTLAHTWQQFAGLCYDAIYLAGSHSIALLRYLPVPILIQQKRSLNCHRANWQVAECLGWQGAY